MKISPRGLALIKEFEGFRGKAYLCPAGVPTIGYGSTKGVTMDDVRRGRTITRAQAEKLLIEHLEEYERGVEAACKVEPNQNQFDALVSFAYNVGVAAMRGSSVIKAHNRSDFNAAARAFGLWTKARVNGKLTELPGLVRRRAAEAALYLEPVAKAPTAAPTDAQDAPTEATVDMPQAVEPERPMTQSHINRASVIAGGTAAAATVAETLQTANSIKYGAQSLGDWLVPLLLITVVALCGYIVWERYKQRKEGRA